MNKEQQLERLAMNIVNQLFDLADVPVEKRQAINDEADRFVLRLLQQCSVIRSVCDCQIPKPIDAYHPIDRHICRDCNGTIEQTDV